MLRIVQAEIERRTFFLNKNQLLWQAQEVQKL